MTKIIICRTRALKRFKEKLGHPIRNLNSVIVGLCAVGNGVAKKPDLLSVSWNPENLKRAEIEARGFAIRSLMVVAYDALDHYLEEIGFAPSPLQDKSLRSILKKESQFESSTNNPTESAINQLRDNLLKKRLDKNEFRICLKDFSDRYCGKAKKPSIRLRLKELYSHCSDFSNSANLNSIPRKSYFAAVEILLAWRNALVHDTETDQLGSDSLTVFLEDSDYLKENHSKINVQDLVDRYNKQQEPSLKDISTLVAILIRFVTSIDSILIENCDLGEFFQEAISVQIAGSANPSSMKDKFSAISYIDRVRKALKISNIHGFILSSFPCKKGAYKSRELDDKDLLFLQNWAGKGFE